MISLTPTPKKKKSLKKSFYLNSIPRFSGVQIRGWPAQKHLFPPGTSGGKPSQSPLSPLRGQQAQASGAGLGGLVLSLLPPHLTPAVPSFSVQYRQCIQPSRGLAGKARETVHSGRIKGHLQEGGEGVLLIEVVPGLLTGFWEAP